MHRLCNKGFFLCYFFTFLFRFFKPKWRHMTVLRLFDEEAFSPVRCPKALTRLSDAVRAGLSLPAV